MSLARRLLPLPFSIPFSPLFSILSPFSFFSPRLIFFLHLLLAQFSPCLSSLSLLIPFPLFSSPISSLLLFSSPRPPSLLCGAEGHDAWLSTGGGGREPYLFCLFLSSSSIRRGGIPGGVTTDSLGNEEFLLLLGFFLCFFPFSLHTITV